MENHINRLRQLIRSPSENVLLPYPLIFVSVLFLAIVTVFVQELGEIKQPSSPQSLSSFINPRAYPVRQKSNLHHRLRQLNQEKAKRQKQQHPNKSLQSRSSTNSAKHSFDTCPNCPFSIFFNLSASSKQ